LIIVPNFPKNALLPIFPRFLSDLSSMDIFISFISSFLLIACRALPFLSTLLNNVSKICFSRKNLKNPKKIKVVR